MFRNEDGDGFVVCPYDKIHRMKRNRLQQHIIKCRKNYPEVELRECPFNKTHLIPEPEYVYHATSCTDRNLITHYQTDDAEIIDEVKQEEIECDENWDDTDVIDYNPKKNIENRQVIRQPIETEPAKRRAFAKTEVGRLSFLEQTVSKTNHISNTNRWRKSQDRFDNTSPRIEQSKKRIDDTSYRLKHPTERFEIHSAKSKLPTERYDLSCGLKEPIESLNFSKQPKQRHDDSLHNIKKPIERFDILSTKSKQIRNKYNNLAMALKQPTEGSIFSSTRYKSSKEGHDVSSTNFNSSKYRNYISSTSRKAYNRRYDNPSKNIETELVEINSSEKKDYTNYPKPKTPPPPIINSWDWEKNK